LNCALRQSFVTDASIARHGRHPLPFPHFPTAKGSR
jgi:hypothetical protein